LSSASAPVKAESGFDHFRLHHTITQGLEAAGFTEPRPIQVEAMPAALEGRDVLGLAQTGTGKTAAFALPILEYLVTEEIKVKSPLVLILAPTRELALQIDAEIRLLAKYTRIRTMTIFGGVPARQQIATLRNAPEIVVGCPGRVLDLVGQRKLDLSRVETLVLDEADHMFDMGFLPDIKRIINVLPNDRQNLLFSATMPKAIRGLADQVLHEPHVVELAHRTPSKQIEHALYPVAEGRKRDLLERMLDADDCKSAIVFTRTKHRARRIAQDLDKRGHRAIALQGNMSQSQRDRAMRGFREGRYDILVATDIAARGLDVAGVDYVINFDPPSTPETYTHRIGRTGRSEATGKACTLVTGEDRLWVRDTERVLGEPIERREQQGFDSGFPIDDFNTQGRGPRSAAPKPGRGGQGRKPAAKGGARRPSRGGSQRSGRSRAASGRG
jgi:ATP-dependent RNA helicase RhlE